MEVRENDVLRKIMYQNIKRVREGKDEELAYTMFNGYEIATIYHKGGIMPNPLEQPQNDSIKTYLWFDRGRFEVLEEYTSIDKAMKGHERWCQKEFV